MQTNMNQLLNPLVEAIGKMMAEANARADAAEQREAEFRAKMAAILNIAPANDVAAVVTPVARVVQPAPENIERTTKVGVSRYPDAIFLEALTHDFQSPHELHHRLIQHGVALGTVYNRYRKLAQTHADAVEQKDGGWRLKAPVTATNDVVTVKPKVAASARKRVGKPKAVRLNAANDHAANDDVVVPTTAIPETTTPLLVYGDGLAMMRGLPDASVDLVLCDLPYGTTRLGIDPVIDVEAWMAEMARIVTGRGAVVAFSAQPFTTDLINASRAFDKGEQMFLKQEVIWEKPQATGFQQANARRLKAHENILIFSHGSVVGRRGKNPMTYNPQGVTRVLKKTRSGERAIAYLDNAVRGHAPGTEYEAMENCPRSVIYGGKDAHAKKLHSFAKPVWLLEDLIRTYSNEDGLVLDPTMGSGSTIVAAINTGRRSIGAENGTDKKGRCIFEIAKQRIAEARAVTAA